MRETKNKKVLNVISLFSGCGGMDLGFRGNFHFLGKYYKKNNFNIVFANDILSHACETYRVNFGTEPWCGDIKDLDYNLLPKAEVVIGGFPCQDFSLAGKRRGLSADRGRLYLEMKKVIEHVKPIAFVAENVDGIRISKKGEDTSALEKIVLDFKDSGYRVVYKVLNAADYGIPQNRKRVIIVGIRKDVKANMSYPKPTHGIKNKEFVTAKDAIDELWNKIDDPNFYNHSSKDYSKAAFHENGKGQGNCRIKADKPAPTIRSEHHGNIEGHYRSLNDANPNDRSNWRRLSVRECARLQSFPDDFYFPHAASVAYKEIGNAVPPVLAWKIANALYNSLITKTSANR